MEYQNLIGLQPLLGERDCFSLVRCFFEQNFDIRITNLARPKDWDADDIDLINMCHEREGFQKITDWKIADLRPADVLCMSIGSRNPNHFAILVDDGNLLHHPSGRLGRLHRIPDEGLQHPPGRAGTAGSITGFLLSSFDPLDQYR